MTHLAAFALRGELKGGWKRPFCISLQGSGEDAGERGKRDLGDFPRLTLFHPFPSPPPPPKIAIPVSQLLNQGRSNMCSAEGDVPGEGAAVEIGA